MPTLDTAQVGTTFGGHVRDEPTTPDARRTRPGWVDAVAVAALTLLTLASLRVMDLTSTVDRDVDAPAVLLVLLAAVVTVLRRRWPVAASLTAGALVATYLVLGYPYTFLFGFVVLTVYTVARHRPPARSVGAAVAVYLMLAAHLLTNDAALDGAAGLVPALAWVLVPFTVGLARRLVVTAQAREREASGRRLVDAERLRLSQEVHDVVGHGLAAIQMQADITLHLSDPRPEQSRAALQAISDASRTALDELRTTLASIRPWADGAERAPTPGLSRAEELCRRVADSGIEVDYDVDGDPRPLPAEADLVAYRLLQESLTNVLKHSAHPHADVRVRHAPDAVTVEVTNQDLGPEPVDGVGITGMRRRVARLGGTFRAGPGPERGTFQVRATIPRSPEASP